MMGPIATAPNGNDQRRFAPPARGARRSNFFVVLLSVTSWLFLLSASACLPRTTATEVKWTASSSLSTAAAGTATALDANGKRQKETAATAPRSQKYWDEHNIERPDYAKTDAELAQEKRGRKGDKSTTTSTTTNGSNNTNTKNSSKIQRVFLLLLMAGVIGYFVVGPRRLQQNGPGSRLGSAAASGGGMGGRRVPSWLLVPIQQLQLQFSPNQHPTAEEKARTARLARFEAPDLARFEAKDD